MTKMMMKNKQNGSLDGLTAAQEQVDARLKDLNIDELTFDVVMEPYVFDLWLPRLPVREKLTFSGNNRYIQCQQNDDISILVVTPTLHEHRDLGRNICYLLKLYDLQICIDLEECTWEGTTVTYVLKSIGGFLSHINVSHDLRLALEKKHNTFIPSYDLGIHTGFRTAYEQEVALKIIEKGLSSYNHRTETKLEWPDGREVDGDILPVIHDEDGKFNFRETRKVLRIFEKENQLRYVDYTIKQGEAAVKFSDPLIRKIKNGELVQPQMETSR